MTTRYLPTIGLEIHAELTTTAKMFCRCKNDPDAEKPNVNVCEICLGHPGTLPVINLAALKNVIRIGIAVGGRIADFTEWDRKHYFYPDIPKGYQISQYKYPLVSDGSLASVAIERIHLEEDTAKSTHDTHEKSLVNFNRSGVPLMELVTKPVIHDATTAVTFAKELQLLLRYLNAGDANMEKGEMRVEANISICKVSGNIDSSTCDTTSNLGTKTEVKNLNSFKSVEKAIAYEIERQTSLLERGQQVLQETRGWDDVKGKTYSQRSKESSHDYRYYPDPDIPKMKLSEIAELSTDRLAASLGELPWIKRARFLKDYAMTDKEVAIMIESLPIAEYFDEMISDLKADKKLIRLAINYLLSDYLGILKTRKSAFDPKTAISPSVFAELIRLVADGIISSRGAKDLVVLLIDSPTTSAKILAEKSGLMQKSNVDDLIPAVKKVLADNPSVVTEYKGGKSASLQYLIGQTMKATRGAGNPEVVKKLLLEELTH